MKTSYQFANLLGSVYSGGNVVFTPDGQSVLSPVGNRLSVFHLARNTSTTLPFQTRKPIARVALNPADPNLVLVADEDGRALLADVQRRSVLANINFKRPLRAASFSNNGRYIAVSHGSQVQVWRIPQGAAKQFNPFELHRVYTGHHDDVLCIQWSQDSTFFLTTSKDHTCRLYSVDPIPLPHNPASAGTGPSATRFRPKTFSGHRAPVIAAFWSQDEREIYTVSRDGACFIWRGKEPDTMHDDDDADSEDDDEGAADAAADTPAARAVRAGNLSESVARIATTRWGLLKRNYFSRPDVRVTCAAFHQPSAVLTVGFNDGVFGLWTLPSFDSIHTLSISNTNISSVALNATGEWLAFGASGIGQLLVWEWQSESYILKQQGHYYDMNAIAYTADGSIAATGGDDGKVKLWNVENGFCIATFSEHSAPISALEFSKGGAGVLFSASLDGTVRAWDLLRYRNFRTFTSPSPCQFGSLAVEANGEVVCAGGTADSFDVFLWNVQTGKLLDVLSGHEGPVSSMAFSPNGSGMLATTSWDKTFRVWEIFRRTATVEPVSLSTEGLALAFRPDGLEVCIATLDGQLAFFDSRTAKQTGVIECRRDIAGGRSVDDKVYRNSNSGGAAFTTLSYTADGGAILAGGNANFICLYSVAERVLLNRWQLSLDLSLDGTQDKLDSRRLTEAGAAELLDVQHNEDELTVQERIDRSLPGAQSGDLAKRTTRRKARTKAIRFSPTGRAFAAATTIGLLVYSLDAPGLLAEEAFDPLELEMDLTPEAVRAAMRKGDSLLALLGALRLNEGALLREVFQQVPINEAPLILSRLPTPARYVPPLMRLLAAQLRPVLDAGAPANGKASGGAASSSSGSGSGSPHLEHTLTFLSHLLTLHGSLIQSNANRGEFSTAARAVSASLSELRRTVKRLGEEGGSGAVWAWEGLERLVRAQGRVQRPVAPREEQNESGLPPLGTKRKARASTPSEDEGEDSGSEGDAEESDEESDEAEGEVDGDVSMSAQPQSNGKGKAKATEEGPASDSDSDSGSSSSEDPSFINVDFDFRSPTEMDEPALRRLLRQLFHTHAPDLELHLVTERIIALAQDEHHPLGTVIKVEGDEDQDPFSFVSALPLGAGTPAQGKDKAAAKQLTGYFLKQLQNASVTGGASGAGAGAGKSAQAMASLLTSTTARPYIYLHERFINLPAQTGPPLYRLLTDELAALTGGKEAPTHVFFFTRVFSREAYSDDEDAAPPAGEDQPRGMAAARQRRQRQRARDAGEKRDWGFFRPEDEVLQRVAAHTHTFRFPPPREAEESYESPLFGRVMLLPWERVKSGSVWGEMEAALGAGMAPQEV